MKLLLVDDEPGIREGLAALLRRKGHVVVTAGDCAQAIAELLGGDLDLVITDWRLPDGLAETFVTASPCPVVAMSGHPEEIVGHPALREVLTKPVLPSRLVELIAGFERAQSCDILRTAIPKDPIPKDTAELVEAATHVLGETTIEDDGTFVIVRAQLRSEAILEQLQVLGGDLRVLTPGGVPTVELRWCRDGRPDAGIPVISPAAAWPDSDEFAIDFSRTTDGAAPACLSTAAFASCIDRAAEGRRHGRIVHFLNVPNSLLSWATGQGRGDDMPMRAQVGPRLPDVLADLWS